MKRSQRGATTLVLLLLLTATGADVSAEHICPLVEHEGLEWSDRQPYDSWGSALALGAHVALVGAPQADYGSTDAGAVLVYYCEGARWTLAQTLHAELPRARANFGAAVALSTCDAVVGAPGAGEVTFLRFRNQAWEHETIVRRGVALGDAVALDGARAVLGDPQGSYNNIPSGLAYVYQRIGTTWRLEAELHPPDPAAGQLFGDAVAICGPTILVGASQDDEKGEAAGAAYVFELAGSNWLPRGKLFAWDASCCVHFAEALVMDGHTAVIGAWRAPGKDALSGAAYVFRHDGAAWTPWVKLIGSDTRNFDMYGGAVALADRIILIGARRADALGRRAGAAYVYREQAGEWLEQAKLVPAAGGDGDYFSASIALRGGRALLGAPRADEGGNDSGAAYAYVGVADCNANDALDACDILHLSSSDADGDGLPDECDRAGDLNCDQRVDADDIRPFVLALGDALRYTARYPDCFLANADANADGKVDFDDIGPFIDLLTR